ncbi:hypothetical protein NTGBS_220014 [Candidatus Nitrotoga sp. BS]|uniref:hypothetical protein n=1 Tax=Candidatus Nitrotoga sp. BS TaxID=2890408 RepID=UPI001EF1B179|nr:hypothetical protein [Candidatus Nitrotoga sp. BS]CAH1197017.1 hypothetical protein NTGBS_220014 [Candidatus Nitrotoga sp. BS]
MSKKKVRDICRHFRKKYNAEKNPYFLAGLRGEDSIAELSGEKELSEYLLPLT